MIRTLLLFSASLLMLGFTTGCNEGPGAPTTRTDRPKDLDRAGGPGKPAQGDKGDKGDSGEKKSPDGATQAK